MIFPTKEELKRLREMYPKGTRVVLLEMDDPQAPPVGTKGTVRYVDDAGGIGVNWDNGSSLSAIYGVDRIKKLEQKVDGVSAFLIRRADDKQ